ncbi:uncharacterized protein LOC128386888 [Panonychus citri]|uniref:uncharacterized protein LOC128386888 n=1 Tax=Panonychus citri TaxID=50023 RepID=UPI002306EF53|nr:uncharacterized protein LOC128386888 [Panonychus citri]
MFEKRLNLTIGAFNFVFSAMFIKENGQTRPALKTLSGLLNTIGRSGNFEINLKTSPDETLGQLSDSGYKTGVLGMLQRQEIDSCFLPLPLDIPNPPGNFSPVIHDDAYHIYSFPWTSTSVTQDVVKSLETINLTLWLTMSAFIFILETINHLVIYLNKNGVNNQCDTIISSLFEALNTVACSVFSQYLPGRSMLRTVQTIAIMLFTITLGVIFSTSTIVGNDEAKINTLEDVISQDKKPLWLEGESVFELFQEGVNTDYTKIYDLGQKKGTASPIPLSSTSIIEQMGHEAVYFCSNEIARVVRKLSESLGSSIAKNEYKSTKPYHRALEAFLMNPAKDAEEIRSRIKKLSIRQIQGDIFIQDLRRIINELLTSSVLGIKPYQLYFSYGKSEMHMINFQPLNFNGCKVVFVSWEIALGVATIVLLVEILSHQLTKPKVHN